MLLLEQDKGYCNDTTKVSVRTGQLLQSKCYCKGRANVSAKTWQLL